MQEFYTIGFRFFGGSFREPSWKHFEASWGSWGHLGVFWRASWGILGGVGRLLGGLGELLGGLGSILGASWDRVKLGPSWGKLGQVRPKLEPSWGKLGPSWGKLEASWRQVGPSFGQVGSS